MDLVTPGETVMNFFIEFNGRQLLGDIKLRAAFMKSMETTNYAFIAFWFF
jgi:hypothetical protein